MGRCGRPTPADSLTDTSGRDTFLSVSRLGPRGSRPSESRRCAGTDHTTDAVGRSARLRSERPPLLNDLLSVWVSLHRFYGLPAIAGAASASDTYSTWCLACQFGLPE